MDLKPIKYDKYGKNNSNNLFMNNFEKNIHFEA